MPYSAGEGKDWIIGRIAPGAVVLDVGTGAGTYAKLLPGRDMYGIEIFEPYVDRFGLASLYRRLYVGDARTLDYPRVDVVILGDVLEHVVKAEALGVWAKARDAARVAVFLSLPIYGYEQGEVAGNRHEAHLHQWSHEEVMCDLPGIAESWQGQIVGAYRADPSRIAR